jgi:hypothetical protein
MRKVELENGELDRMVAAAVTIRMRLVGGDGTPEEIVSSAELSKASQIRCGDRLRASGREPANR